MEDLLIMKWELSTTPMDRNMMVYFLLQNVSNFLGVISDYKAHGYGILERKTEDGVKTQKGRFENDELVEELKEEEPEEPQSKEVNDHEIPKELTSTISKSFSYFRIYS